MKKIVILALLCIFAMPLTALGHTTLTESNPAEGEVLAEIPKNIELTFGTVIEEASTMELQGENSTYTFENISVSDNILSGTVNEDLENGQYIIVWKIIGEDGHPIEGEIPFGIDAEPAAEEPVAEEEPALEEQPAAEESVSQDEEAEVDEDGSSSPWITVLIAALAIIIIFGIIKLVKKK